ncbi:uncharacterized protein LOC117980782 [Pan paniscus]|uniref:uncharacterized protein LOC117980782 n=1 Tax=Pan paniscus TaxID=9597 RepID=UPI0015602215
MNPRWRGSHRGPRCSAQCSPRAARSAPTTPRGASPPPAGAGDGGEGGYYRRAAAAAAAAASQRWWLLQQPGSAGGSVRRGVEEAAGGLLRAGGTGEEGAGGYGSGCTRPGRRQRRRRRRSRGWLAVPFCPWRLQRRRRRQPPPPHPRRSPVGVSKSLLLLSSPPGASEPPLSLFFLFFRTAQAPGAKNNRGSGERRVPAARISGPKRGWRRRGRPMQRIARRRRQPGCCGRQLKNGSRKLLLTMNEGIRFTRQGPPAKLGFPAGFSNHICISPPLNPPRTVPTAHWASTSLLQSQSWSRAATYWFPLAAVHHGYRGDRAPICIGFLDWLAEEQFLGGGAKTFLLSHGRPRLA